MLSNIYVYSWLRRISSIESITHKYIIRQPEERIYKPKAQHLSFLTLWVVGSKSLFNTHQ